MAGNCKRLQIIAAVKSNEDYGYKTILLSPIVITFHCNRIVRSFFYFYVASLQKYQNYQNLIRSKDAFYKL